MFKINVIVRRRPKPDPYLVSLGDDISFHSLSECGNCCVRIFSTINLRSRQRRWLQKFGVLGKDSLPRLLSYVVWSLNSLRHVFHELRHGLYIVVCYLGRLLFKNTSSIMLFKSLFVTTVTFIFTSSSTLTL